MMSQIFVNIITFLYTWTQTKYIKCKKRLKLCYHSLALDTSSSSSLETFSTLAKLPESNFDVKVKFPNRTSIATY